MQKAPCKAYAQQGFAQVVDGICEPISGNFSRNLAENWVYTQVNEVVGCMSAAQKHTPARLRLVRAHRLIHAVQIMVGVHGCISAAPALQRRWHDVQQRAVRPQILCGGQRPASWAIHPLPPASCEVVSATGVQQVIGQSPSGDAFESSRECPSWQTLCSISIALELADMQIWA